MKDYIFHTPTGWKWNKFPKKPYTEDAFDYAGDLLRWEEQVSELKASALDVANPDVIPRVGNDGYPIFEKKDGELYHWSGEVRINQIYTRVNRGEQTYIEVAVLSLPKPEADLKNMKTDNEIELERQKDIKKYGDIFKNVGKN